MNVAEVLNAAADLLEKPGGWTQETYGKWDEGNESYSCLCLFGALGETAGWLDDATVSVKALDAVRVVVGDNPIEWNDAPGRTQAEVVQALRQAAEAA